MAIAYSDLLFVTIIVCSLVMGITIARKTKSRSGFVWWCLSWYVGACYLAGTVFIFLGGTPHGLPMNWIGFIISPMMPFFIFSFLFTKTKITTDLLIFSALFAVFYIMGL